MRAYLYETINGERVELSDHPANGAEWLASGPALLGPDGDRQFDTVSSVVVFSPRACAALDHGEIAGEQCSDNDTFGRGCFVLRAKHFPGRLVSVKVWSPGEIIEWRLLA